MIAAASFWLIAGDIALGVGAVLLSVAAIFAFIVGMEDGVEWWGLALAFTTLAVLAAAGATAVHAA